MKYTEKQLLTGNALCAYNALMRWFEKSSGIQISAEDSVKCMLWLDCLADLVKDSKDYEFVDRHYLDIWPVALNKVTEDLKKLKWE